MKKPWMLRGERGSVTVLAAVVLYIVVLIGVVAWAGIQEWADHALLGRLLGKAAYDASRYTDDAGLVAGTPTLRCLDPTCAPVSCAAALANDAAGTTAPGRACVALQQGLASVYGSDHARLDIATTLVATRVWILPPGAADPEDAGRVYHFPTICLSLETTVGVLAHDGLVLPQHIHACAQVVYR